MATTEVKFSNFKKIVFFTGAGLSAESGIPTFRGKGGTWSQYNFEDYACQKAFDRDPEKVWDFHDERRVVAAECEPNRAHQIIAEVQKMNPATKVITQNIDGLLDRVGVKDTIELHGSLWRVRCYGCEMVTRDDTAPIRSRKCECGQYFRPDIVWFGDMLDDLQMQNARTAIRSCDLLISVGTSASVFPAAHLPFYAMPEAFKVEVNPEITDMTSEYNLHLSGPASEMLEKML